MIDPTLLTTTYDLYRPFGTSSPTYTNLPCRIIPDLACGRGSGLSGVLSWTHYMDVQPADDVLDGCGRAAGGDFVLYSDGDEVKSPAGQSHPTYAIVWVELRNQGTPDDFKRVYLIRDVY